MGTGMKLIVEERRRQINVEGWTIAHDDECGHDALENAALSYRDAAGPDSPIPNQWPSDSEWWKPKSRHRNLERSGALYLAAAEAAERAKNYEARDRLNSQAQSCAILLESLIS